MSKETADYEKLTQAIYQAMLDAEGVKNIKVEHDVKVIGKSGVVHQIDVYWKFRLANNEHSVAVECKKYRSLVKLSDIRSFYSVVDDIGPCNGVMVTQVGYQRGVVKFAKHNNIKLKLLKSSADEDLKGLVREFKVRMFGKRVQSTEQQPMEVGFIVDKSSISEELNQLYKSKQIAIGCDIHTHLLHSDGLEYDEALSRWLPKNLDILNKEDGGPYSQTIITKDAYIKVERQNREPEFARLRGIYVRYYVESERYEFVVHAQDIIRAIMRDYTTKEIEYIQRY
jgi:hypothetical protein